MNHEHTTKEWKQAKTDVFWAEIAPCDHVVQIYESDAIFLDALAGFVGGGINAGDSSIVIATSEHLRALEERLRSFGIYIGPLKSDNRYIPLNAEETLDKFMVNGWPDENLFMETIKELINKAGTNNRKIRAFGEMVAILWAKGHNGATVQLEHLWNKLCQSKTFSLFCAYPKTGFTGDINSSIAQICGTHSKMIAGTEKQLTEVIFRDIEQKKAV